MWLVFLAGTVAGAVHVLSGPDHLAAVAPLSVRDGSRARAAGLRWGIGHAVGVAVLATAALLLREVLPLDAISGVAERVVGALLIGIGLWALRLALRARVHVHEHEHDGVRHRHAHLHTGAAHDPDHPVDQLPGPARAHDHRHLAFGVGALHGLAGTAHLVSILPALALPSTGHAVAYLGGYGLGTVASMVAFAWALGRAAKRLGRHGDRAARALLGTTALVAVAVGVAWLRT
jgi:ABC-type nickel/cobalt efflux system permease component RcnA